MRVFCICLLILLSQSISAQDKGSITFKVDVVSKPENHLSGWDGKKVAEKCKSLQRIDCKAIVPPELDALSNDKVQLFVPATSLDAYRNAKR